MGKEGRDEGQRGRREDRVHVNREGENGSQAQLIHYLVSAEMKFKREKNQRQQFCACTTYNTAS